MWFVCENGHMWKISKIEGHAAHELDPKQINSKCRECGSKDISWILNPHYKKYLFCWNEISKNDSKEFRDFLKKDYNIDWVKTEDIEKIDDVKTIKVSAERNYLSLTLNNDETKVELQINDGRPDEFIASNMNGKIKIFMNRSIGIFRINNVVSLNGPSKRNDDDDIRGHIELDFKLFLTEKDKTNEKIFWFPYWITINNKKKFGQYSPIILEKDFVELLENAIKKDFFQKGSLDQIKNAIDEYNK